MYGLWNDKTMLSLHKGLDAAAARQRAAAHNISNVNTPNFKRSVVSFEEDLKRALSGGKKRLADVRHVVTTDRTLTMRTDGNNVDIDAEMALMAANQLNYNAMVQLVNEKYSMLRYVIHEGRR